MCSIEDGPYILERIKSALVANQPCKYSLIKTFAPSKWFCQLDRSWPSNALFPVPSEQNSLNPRRKHFWLHNKPEDCHLHEYWRQLSVFCTSKEFKTSLIGLASLMGVSSHGDTECWVRLCEEKLPYILEAHRDQKNKLLSLIWLFSQDRSLGLGTDLYQTDGSAFRVEAPINSALCIANTLNSYHGGNWDSTEIPLRRSVHIFLVEKP